MIKRLKLDPEARELVSSTGMQPYLSEESHYGVEQFVLTKMYGCLPGSTCAEARAKKMAQAAKEKYSVPSPPFRFTLPLFTKNKLSPILPYEL